MESRKGIMIFAIGTYIKQLIMNSGKSSEETGPMRRQIQKEGEERSCACACACMHSLAGGKNTNAGGNKAKRESKEQKKMVGQRNK